MRLGYIKEKHTLSTYSLPSPFGEGAGVRLERGKVGA